MKNEVEVKILGGLPVTVEYVFNSANEFRRWCIVKVNGKELNSSPKWLYKRIDAICGEEDKIVNACFNHYGTEDF